MALAHSCASLPSSLCSAAFPGACVLMRAGAIGYIRRGEQSAAAVAHSMLTLLLCDARAVCVRSVVVQR